MSKKWIIGLAVLALLISAASADARSYGNANRVIFGAQQGPLIEKMAASGDATFTLGSADGKPVYDVSVQFSPCYEPYMTTQPDSLQLLVAPRHIAARDGSFSAPGNNGGYFWRWHASALPASGIPMSLTLRFKVPNLVSTFGGVPSPYLCVRASVWSDVDGTAGPETTLRWYRGGGKGGK